MTASVYIAGATGNSGSQASITLSLGSGFAGYVVAQFSNHSGGSAPTLEAPKVDGNSMTALFAEQSQYSSQRCRLYGYQLTGAETSITVTANLGVAGADNFYQKSLNVVVWQNTATTPISGIVFAVNSGSGITYTIASATGDIAGAQVSDDDGRTLTPGTGDTSVTGSGIGTAYEWALTTAGASTATISGSYPGTTAAYGHGYSVAGSAAAPVLTSPTGTPTGNTAATIGVTSDTAPTTTAISYQILPAATAAPSAATIVGAPTGTITTGSAGALTKAITVLTTDTAVKVHFAQGETSNVVSSASFTPPTMASSGSLSAQSGTASTAFAWTGATPESQITVQGVGSSAWTLTSAGGSGLSTINSSTGVPGGTLTATPGVYTVTVTKTDSSTAGTNPTGGGAPPQTIVRTISLTVSAPVLRGFKFSSAAGLQLGTIVGSLTGLGLSADGEAWTAFAHDDTTRALVATSGTLTVAGGAGRLPDWSHASIGAGTYFVSLRRNSDGASCSARLISEVI